MMRGWWTNSNSAHVFELRVRLVQITLFQKALVFVTKFTRFARKFRLYFSVSRKDASNGWSEVGRGVKHEVERNVQHGETVF